MLGDRLIVASTTWKEASYCSGRKH